MAKTSLPCMLTAKRSPPSKNSGLYSRRVYPLDFSTRGSTNVLFYRFRFVLSMDTWKTRCGTLWHILASGIAAAGQFSLHVQESSKCYRPNVTKDTPGSYALHHFVNHALQHTSTYILGPLARFGGIPVLRGSFPPKTAFGGPRVVYPPRFLRARFHQCTFL